MLSSSVNPKVRGEFTYSRLLIAIAPIALGTVLTYGVAGGMELGSHCTGPLCAGYAQVGCLQQLAWKDTLQTGTSTASDTESSQKRILSSFQPPSGCPCGKQFSSPGRQPTHRRACKTDSAVRKVIWVSTRAARVIRQPCSQTPPLAKRPRKA